MIIDSHAHIWPAGLMHPAQRQPLALAAEPADLLATMDRHGVDLAIIGPASVHPDLGFVLGAAERWPDRALVVAAIDHRAAEATTVMDSLAATRVAGIRLKVMDREPPDEGETARLRAIAEVAASQGLVVQWTIGLDASHVVEAIAARTLDGHHLVDHLGLPHDVRATDRLDRMRALADVPNVMVKLSGLYALSRDGYPYRDTWDWIEGVVAAFGADRTVWGSDWPLVTESAPYGDQLALVDQLPFLDGDARRWIMGDTARRLWTTAAAVASR